MDLDRREWRAQCAVQGIDSAGLSDWWDAQWRNARLMASGTVTLPPPGLRPFGGFAEERKRNAEGSVFAANRATGHFVVMSGVSPRHMALQSYANYELADIDTGDLEAAYGHLIGHSDDETATLGDWSVSIREDDLAGIRRRTLEEAQESGGQLTLMERWALDGG